MASGHVNRIYRPNTWLYRPSLRREDFSCQPGAVHTWHFSDLSGPGADVRSWGVERTSQLRVSTSEFDPQQNSRSGCLFFRTAHECSITTRCLRSPAGRIESWRRGAGSRSPTIGRRALR
jgi:hypothetical protein